MRRHRPVCAISQFSEPSNEILGEDKHAQTPWPKLAQCMKVVLGGFLRCSEHYWNAVGGKRLWRCPSAARKCPNRTDAYQKLGLPRSAGD